jgi:uncharacterized membrane protein
VPRGSRTLTQTTLLISGLLFALLRGLAMALDSGFLMTLSKLALACLVLVALAWAFRVLWRSFFWRVGRRLAFSYFTVGVLPMAMLALIFLLAAYLFGGFLLGHLYRHSVNENFTCRLRWQRRQRGARGDEAGGDRRRRSGHRTREGRGPGQRCHGRAPRGTAAAPAGRRG